jgi:hypothetical protein
MSVLYKKMRQDSDPAAPLINFGSGISLYATDRDPPRARVADLMHRLLTKRADEAVLVCVRYL